MDRQRHLYRRLLALNTCDIVKSVADTGFFAFARAVRPEFLDQLQRELGQYQPGPT